MLISGAGGAACGIREPAQATLTIGLVGATKKRGGERHFEKLLTDAAPGRFTLRHFTLGEELDALWEAELDGLIVAGAEPRAATMPEEPIWADLSRLVDWAGAHTIGTIWSCFSAHAAVYRLDGIAREKLPQKLSGVMDCANAGIGVLAGLPARIAVPHSRCNNLDEEALLDHGYTILSRAPGDDLSGAPGANFSRAPGAGADTFCKPHLASQFLFLQGHPEYGPRTLAAEYNRDIGRFLAGTLAYPVMPTNYFAPTAEMTLKALQTRLIDTGEHAAFADFAWADLELLDHDWHGAACHLYAAWLDGIAERKVRR